MIESLVGAILLVLPPTVLGVPAVIPVVPVYFSSPEACAAAANALLEVEGGRALCVNDYFLVPESDMLAVEDPR